MFINKTSHDIGETGSEKLKANLGIKNKDALSRSTIKSMRKEKDLISSFSGKHIIRRERLTQTNRWQFRNVLYRVGRKPEQLLPSGTSSPECCEDSTGDRDLGGQP